MVAPEVPAGDAVGQRVLDDQAHGQPLDPAGVQALGRGEVSQIGGEATVAAATAMPGEGNEEVAGSLGASIGEVVEAACVQCVSASPPATAWAATRGVVAGAPCEPRLGQVFDTSDTFGDVRDILAWPSHV